MEALQEAIAFLCQKEIGSKEETESSLEIIRSHAIEDGLEPSDITTLINPAGSCKFGTIFSRSLIRCLIPKSTVEQEAALSALAWLASDETNIRIKALLVKWVILVYDYLDGDDHLSCIYAVLFTYLHSQELRPFISHLLCYLTKRKDVVSYRVDALLEMHKKGDEQPINALLWVYKRYRPDVLLYPIKSSKNLLFKVFEKDLAANIAQVQEKRRRMSIEMPSGSAFVRGSLPNPAKRPRMSSSIIPSTAARLGASLKPNAIPMSEIQSFKQLAENIDRVEMPAQIASCLKSDFVCHCLALSSDRSHWVRLMLWLEHAFALYFLMKPNQFSSQAEEILHGVTELTKYIQGPLAGVQDVFLPCFLQVWNGEVYLEDMLVLMSYLKPQDFKKFRDSFLEPVTNLCFDKDAVFKARVVETWRNLLENILLFKWSSSDEDDEDDDGFDLMDMLSSFIRYIDTVCLSWLEVENDNAFLQKAVVDFFRKVALLFRQHDVLVVVLPSPFLCTRLLFSNCAVTVSSTCSILAMYQPTIRDIFKLSDLDVVKMSMINETASLLNSYIVDLCNALWRSSAFKRRDDVKSTVMNVPTEALRCLDIPQSELQTSLLIYCQIPFLGFLMDFLQSGSDGEGLPIRPSQLSRTQRLDFLDYLRRRGLAGVDEFISLFTTARRGDHSIYSSENH
ncbi:centromere protein I-like [Oscarella lobularis]|uniref:centromere protein I-like n=1 Tax=Oscarella lobularis TaxID=121494 RepID=UPI0033143C19